MVHLIWATHTAIMDFTNLEKMSTGIIKKAPALHDILFSAYNTLKNTQMNGDNRRKLQEQ